MKHFKNQRSILAAIIILGLLALVIGTGLVRYFANKEESKSLGGFYTEATTEDGKQRCADLQAYEAEDGGVKIELINCGDVTIKVHHGKVHKKIAAGDEYSVELPLNPKKSRITVTTGNGTLLGSFAPAPSGG